ncbi:MAG: hypothetical protein A3F68_11520 [Acidobacteria bacterium RIFCSPLOWO2_12_FULL_54_10]|nr:MAG: hypothetical protein A3F68_11520 [Acidobacteria bacterium RIFCSPLOWO2_12_FULL_54_10]
MHKAGKYVVCIYNEGYQASLELHKLYRVLPDTAATKHGDLRIVDESGEDYLYPASWFVPIRVPEKVEASLVRDS